MPFVVERALPIEGDRYVGIGPALGVVRQPIQSMKTPSRLRTLSINLSLVILALGFSALGLVSVISKQPNLSTGIFSVEHTYSLIGSVFSVLVGAIFLVAAIAFRGMSAGSERLAARINAQLI
jgi:hypothetical protein